MKTRQSNAENAAFKKILARFIPRNYSRAADLQPHQWLHQIAFRRDIYAVVLRTLEDPNYRASGYTAEKLLETIRKKPIIDVMKFSKRLRWPQGKLTCFVNCHAVRYFGNPEPVVSLYSQVSSGNVINPKHTARLSRTSALFHVDIDAPDALIMDQFARELRHARRTVRIRVPDLLGAEDWINNKVNRSLFKTEQWLDMKLLPYIDMTLMAAHERLGPIPDALIASKLFWDRRYGKRLRARINKKIKPNAFALLQGGDFEFCRRVSRMLSEQS
jgi:hypothetical protein